MGDARPAEVAGTDDDPATETVGKHQQALTGLDAYVEEVVANAGPLSREHIERLRRLLPPGRTGRAGST